MIDKSASEQFFHEKRLPMVHPNHRRTFFPKSKINPFSNPANTPHAAGFPENKRLIDHNKRTRPLHTGWRVLCVRPAWAQSNG